MRMQWTAAKAGEAGVAAMVATTTARASRKRAAVAFMAAPPLIPKNLSNYGGLFPR